MAEGRLGRQREQSAARAAEGPGYRYAHPGYASTRHALTCGQPEPSPAPYSGAGCAKAPSAVAHSSARVASSQTKSIAWWIRSSVEASPPLFSADWTSFTLT